jgi:hypothetical protein
MAAIAACCLKNKPGSPESRAKSMGGNATIETSARPIRKKLSCVFHGECQRLWDFYL